MKRTRIPQELLSLGESGLGCPLQWIPNRSPCRVLIIAGIHGEEPDTTICLSRALRSIEEVDESVAILLCANPDGHILGTRGNAAGVDLNRNFPSENWQEEAATCRWFFDEEETVPILTGTEPASEPETKRILELIGNVEPERLLALHGPIGCIDDPDSSPEGKWLAGKTGLPLVSEIGYPTPGSLGSWAAEQGLPAVTWEFPCHAIESLCRSQVPVLEEILRGESPFTSPRTDA